MVKACGKLRLQKNLTVGLLVSVRTLKSKSLRKSNYCGCWARALRPHADTLKSSRHSNLKELRADAKDQVLRIAFAFDPDRQAILLLGGNKSGVSQKRFYKQLIAKADAIYDEHLARMAARKKGQRDRDG